MLTAPLLIAEHPLQILPSLAVAIGLNEAIVLQQVHYWLVHNRNEPSKRKTHYRADSNGVMRWWTYNTYKQWREHNFPFLSEPTIKRAFTSLGKQELIITEMFNSSEGDRTKWYSILYDNVSQIQPPSDQIDLMPKTPAIQLFQPSDQFDLIGKETPSDQIDPTHPIFLIQSSDQSDLTMGSERSDHEIKVIRSSYTETIPETSNRKNKRKDFSSSPEPAATGSETGSERHLNSPGSAQTNSHLPVKTSNLGEDQSSGAIASNVHYDPDRPWMKFIEKSAEWVTDQAVLGEYLGRYITENQCSPIVAKGNLRRLFAAGYIELWVGPEQWDWRPGAIAVAKSRIILNTNNESPSDADAKRYINNRINDAIARQDWGTVNDLLECAKSWEADRIASVTAREGAVSNSHPTQPEDWTPMPQELRDKLTAMAGRSRGVSAAKPKEILTTSEQVGDAVGHLIAQGIVLQLRRLNWSTLLPYQWVEFSGKRTYSEMEPGQQEEYLVYLKGVADGAPQPDIAAPVDVEGLDLTSSPP